MYFDHITRLGLSCHAGTVKIMGILGDGMAVFCIVRWKRAFRDQRQNGIVCILKCPPTKFICYRLVPQHMAILGGGRNFRGEILLEEAGALGACS